MHLWLTQAPSPSVERTSLSPLCIVGAAAHVERRLSALGKPDSPQRAGRR